MSFGAYQPRVGVALGHRETSSHMSAEDRGRLKERIGWESREKFNPITGEPLRPAQQASSLEAGSLVPTAGPTTWVAKEANRDAPLAKPDPTKNQSLGLGAGCVPHAPPEREGPPSRCTAGSLGDGLVEREPPGARSVARVPTEAEILRPRDQLGPGLMGPVGDARRPSAGNPWVGRGSGGPGHLTADPSGFMMPRAGPDDRWDRVEAALDARLEAGDTASAEAAVPFRRAYGEAGPALAAAGARRGSGGRVSFGPVSERPF